MGLDMYIKARSKNKKEDVKLAYWRKHPNLHGLIVHTWAGGVDNCQEIPLTRGAIEHIKQCVNNGTLPFTEGFFFGRSSGCDIEKENDNLLLDKVLQHMDENPDDLVYYQASW